MVLERFYSPNGSRADAQADWWHIDMRSCVATRTHSLLTLITPIWLSVVLAAGTNHPGRDPNETLQARFLKVSTTATIF
jgi:hypothetical protein